MIPVQAKMVDKTEFITAPWITFFNSIINKYNPAITVDLLTRSVTDIYNVAAAESGSIIDNDGCDAIQTINLPLAVTGLEYRIICSTDFAVHLVPQAGEWIIGASAAGKYFSLDGIGSSAYLACINFGKWQVMSSHGANSFEA